MSLMNPIVTILKRFDDFIEVLVLKNVKVYYAICFQKNICMLLEVKMG